MKYLFVMAISLIACFGASAQFNASISGQVIDENTNKNLPFASVAVSSLNGDLVNGSITDLDGYFSLQGVEPGKYTLSVSFVGYENYQANFLVSPINQYYDLGKIALDPSNQELNEVVVQEDRAVVSADLDKKSYELDNNIAQSGGSVMDAMKTMPSVSFDQEGKVILRGSDKVIVLIDGTQSSLTGFGNQKGLDNIPAANIERIEIINNPSAKYDASGMAGIINIIYKKEKQAGFHGSAGFAYGLGALSKRKDDLPTDLGSFSPTPKYIPSVDLNYKKEKLSLFFQSEVFQQERLPNNEFTTRYYDDGRVIASQVPENRKQFHYILKGGVDYEFDKRNSLSISGIYDWESHIDSAQVPYIDMSNASRNRFITWNEHEITGYMNYLLNYKHKFVQRGHELNARMQYSKGWEDETYAINDSSSIRINGREITRVLGTEHTSIGSLDYTKPLASGRIESGAKVQIRNLPVTYEQERDENSILYPGLGTWTNWGESLYAGYLNWVHEKSRYAVEAGLRMEYSSVFYDMDEENIYYQKNDAYTDFNLFPNVRLTYKINDKNRLSAFYNHRVDRPGEPELRMFAKSDDHELVKVGNPYLRPQYTQSTELGYKTAWNGGSLFLAAYYRIITDPYLRVYSQDTSRTEYDVVLKSYANTGKAKNLGFEVVFEQKIADYWKLSGNFNFYQNEIEAYKGTLYFPYEHDFDVEQSIDGNFDFKLINTFELLHALNIQLSGLYIGSKNTPQGKAFARSSIDLGIQKKLWQGKGEITLSCSDIFNRYGVKEEIVGDGFTALYENYYETQVIRIGFKYRF